MRRPSKTIQISPDKPAPLVLRKAAGILRRGGLVAFPTETVYGLGADAFNEAAVRSVFAAKGRPTDNPLIVHVASVEQARELVQEFPPLASRLVDKFWPGPLTLVLRHKGQFPSVVTAGLDTVAVRMPAQNVALGLIRALGRPIVGPSANLSGRPSPTRAEHVAADLDNRVDLILDAGPTHIGLESTVLDLTESPPAILRLGGLTREKIESLIGPTETHPLRQRQRRSPGTRHKHYSPKARVVLVEQGDQKAFTRLLRKEQRAKHRVGVIVHSESLESLTEGETVRLLPQRIEGFAKGYFEALRDLDKQKLDVILVETVPREGLGATIMDRLERAAKQ